MNATEPSSQPPLPSDQVDQTEEDEVKKGDSLAFPALAMGIGGLVPVIGCIWGLEGVIVGIIALLRGTNRKRMAQVGILVGIMGPLLQVMYAVYDFRTSPHVREPAKRAICGTNLNSIGKAIALYRLENDDAPTRVAAIFAVGHVSQEHFRCPSAESDRGIDYFYLPPARPKEADGTTIIACDFKDNHKGEGRNVLYWSFSVQWMTEQDFQAELQKPTNAEFAAALMEAEGP